jgi:hypothetical protein
MLRSLLRLIVLISAVGLFLSGLVWLGQLALERVRGQDRYKVRLADVQCQPPAGMTRGDFLDEVRYVAGLPAELPLLDEELPRQLAEAFAQHPWVDKVEQVMVLPGNQVRVQLKYRTAVLAVPWDGDLRAVDARGVLLPATAATTGLPIFDGIALPPRGPAGTAWGDDAVLAAAKHAAETEMMNDER